MECNRYGDDSTCEIFTIFPSVLGSVLIFLSSLQMFREWLTEKGRNQDLALDQPEILNEQQILNEQEIPNDQEIPNEQQIQGERRVRVGGIMKDIHRTVFGCSPIYTIGWLLNTKMDTAIELLIADIFIDEVTVSLAYMLWIIALEKVGSWYYARTTRVLPTLPRLFIDVLLLISITWVFVNNFINFYIDRLWPRAFFYYWLAAIFAFGIVLLTLLVLYLKIRVQRLPDSRWLWGLVILVFIIGGVAILSQIVDGTNILRDRDTPFFAKLPEDAKTFSLIFMSIQGGMMLAGIVYAWIKPPRDISWYQALAT